jgi:hypothetical protein
MARKAASLHDFQSIEAPKTRIAYLCTFARSTEALPMTAKKGKENLTFVADPPRRSSCPFVSALRVTRSSSPHHVVSHVVKSFQRGLTSTSLTLLNRLAAFCFFPFFPFAFSLTRSSETSRASRWKSRTRA